MAGNNFPVCTKLKQSGNFSTGDVLQLMASAAMYLVTPVGGPSPSQLHESGRNCKRKGGHRDYFVELRVAPHVKSLVTAESMEMNP